MSTWTLRGGHPNRLERPTSPAERRAVRHVRRHANETGPLDMAVPPAPAVGYQLGELFGGFRAALDGLSQARIFTEMGGRVVAWRGEITGNLYCLDHAPRKSASPLASGDLPDGGVCIDCGKDVLT